MVLNKIWILEIRSDLLRYMEQWLTRKEAIKIVNDLSDQFPEEYFQDFKISQYLRD